MSVAAIAQPVRARLLAPVSWGLVFGVAQGHWRTNALQPWERP